MSAGLTWVVVVAVLLVRSGSISLGVAWLGSPTMAVLVTWPEAVGRTAMVIVSWASKASGLRAARTTPFMKVSVPLAPAFESAGTYVRPAGSRSMTTGSVAIDGPR